MKLLIFTDGGSRGNPGPAATGFVIYDGQTKAPIYKGGSYLGESTNNIAEFSALLQAIKKALEFNPTAIECFLDSELLVNQLNGIYKTKAPHLKELIGRIKETAFGLSIKYTHVLRHRNKEADAVVNKILDKYEKQH